MEESCRQIPRELQHKLQSSLRCTFIGCKNTSFLHAHLEDFEISCSVRIMLHRCGMHYPWYQEVARLIACFIPMTVLGASEY